ncbi:MAG: hypothetical protein ACR2FE_01670 [Aeromicrobium sp.]
MKRRVEGRSVPLQELLEGFLRQRPPASDDAAHEEWKAQMYLAAADAGFTGLEVFRQMRPRPAPSKRRPS